MTAIEEPTKTRFEQTFVVGDEVIDELGHVSNLVYLEWAMNVARGHSAAIGYSAERYVEIGAAFVVRRHEIDYIRSIRAGQKVMVATWIDSWRSASSVRMTEITAWYEGAVAPIVAAKVRTEWVFAALESGRPKRIPPELRAGFNEFKNAKPDTEKGRAD